MNIKEEWDGFVQALTGHAKTTLPFCLEKCCT